MSMSAKIKALLNLSGKNHTELAEYLGISKQSLSNKFYRGSFSAADLVKVANFTGSCLCFLFPDGNKVVIDNDNIKSE